MSMTKTNRSTDREQYTRSLLRLPGHALALMRPSETLGAFHLAWYFEYISSCKSQALSHSPQSSSHQKGRKRRTWERGHGQSRIKSLDFKSVQTCADCFTDFQVEARFYTVYFNLKNDKTPLSGYVMLPLRTQVKHAYLHRCYVYVP